VRRLFPAAGESLAHGPSLSATARPNVINLSEALYQNGKSEPSGDRKAVETWHDEARAAERHSERLTDMDMPSIRVIGPNRANYFLVEFCSSKGECLTFFISEHEAGNVLADIQERIPYGLKLPDPADVR